VNSERPSAVERDLARKFGRGIRQLFVWLNKLIPARFKRITMLALPYQVAAVITVFIAVGYTLLFKYAEKAQLYMLSIHPDWIFLTAPICFLISWWLVRTFAPYAGGSGIPQLTAAIEVADETERDRSWRFLNPRIILVKIASSLAVVVGGGAVGREGPTLQIAGSVYRAVHQWLPPFWPKIQRRMMIITGGAAGLSAAFNTPLGGIVFVIEELTKTHIAQFRTAVFASVIIAGMTAQWLLGSYFSGELLYPQLGPVGASFMYKVLLISLPCGLLGAIFCKVLLATDKLRRRLKSWTAQLFMALGCALAFATCVHFFGPHTLGSGGHFMEQYLFSAEQVDPSWKDVVARLLGPIFTSSAGGAGGTFGPSLASGAAIGGWVAQWFEPSRGEFNVLVLCGMTAFLTGTSRSPFTCAILVLEMTDRHSIILQLMYAAMVAYLVSQTIDKRSYYERMKQRLLATLPEWKGWRRAPDETDEQSVPGLG
jgi:H+/Cl- antiporter ClcA